jgi:hypothetical protein
MSDAFGVSLFEFRINAELDNQSIDDACLLQAVLDRLTRCKCYLSFPFTTKIWNRNNQLENHKSHNTLRSV